MAKKQSKRVPLVTFSMQFGIPSGVLKRMGVFNPILTFDLPWFIDPLLLARTRVPEFKGASDTFLAYFNQVVTALRTSKNPGDIYWKAAEGLLTFNEVEGLCLGHGQAGNKGRGPGPEMAAKLIVMADEIIKAGYRNPDLFLILPMLQEGFGPDGISDMTGYVIQDHLLEYTQRVTKTLSKKYKITTCHIGSERTPSKWFTVPVNPFSGEIVILVPSAILRRLPIVSSITSISSVSSDNQAIRDRLNKYIGESFYIRNNEDRRKAREALIKAVKEGPEAVRALIDLIESISLTQPTGVGEVDLIEEVREELENLSSNDIALQLVSNETNPERIHRVVSEILDKFKLWVEVKRYSRFLWNGDKLRPEKDAQLLFFVFASFICTQNNIDVSPETDDGAGPVDFKISSGSDSKSVVEIKLSTNPNVVHGYSKQLTAYMKAAEASRAYYVIIGVGDNDDKKYVRVYEQRDTMLGNDGYAHDIFIVDGHIRESASKLR